MPEFNLPNVDIEKAVADFNNAVKEAAYVAVGLGVLGFQRAQVQRVELTKQLEEQFRNLPAAVKGPIEGYTQFAKEQAATARTTVNEQLTELAKSVDEAVAPVRQQFEEQLDRLEEVLPQTARDLVQSLRGAASSQEQAIRSAVGLS